MGVTAEFVRFTRLSAPYSRATLSHLSPQLVYSITFVQSEPQIKEEYVLALLSYLCKRASRSA